MMNKIKIDADINELKRLYILQNVNLESIKGLSGCLFGEDAGAPGDTYYP